jgi:ABC-type transporter lipoprotein component MlaA
MKICMPMQNHLTLCILKAIAVKWENVVPRVIKEIADHVVNQVTLANVANTVRADRRDQKAREDATEMLLNGVVRGAQVNTIILMK